jgi:hypothetical protein
MTNVQVCEEFYDKCDVDDYDDYIRNLHDYNRDNSNYNRDNSNNDSDDYIDDNPYDYEDVFGNRPESIEGISPGSNITNNFSYVNNIDSKPRQVCFDELYGKCLKSPNECRYSHEVKDLEREALKKHNEISKYLPQDKRPTPSRMIPTSILKRDPSLRTMSTIDAEGKVSTANINNNNNRYNRSNTLSQEDLSKEKN